MAIEYRDCVIEFTYTQGTGTLTLAGKPPGWLTALEAFGAGDHESYWICRSAAGLWEMFRGTVNGTLLTRTEVLSSSNDGAAVNFLAGRKEVRCTLPAEVADILTNAAGDVILKNGSVAFTENQSLGNHKLINVLNPTAAQDAATKAYTDAGDAATLAAANAYTDAGDAATLAAANAYTDAEIAGIVIPAPDGGVLPPGSTTDQALATWDGTEGVSLRDNPGWTIVPASQKMKAKCRYIPRSAVVSGANPNLDCNLTDNQRMLLTANAVPTVSNATIDQFLYVRIRQDATGGRTLDWSSVNVQWVGDEDHVMTSTANREDAVMLHCVAIDGYGNPAFLGYVIGQDTPIVDSWS